MNTKLKRYELDCDYMSILYSETVSVDVQDLYANLKCLVLRVMSPIKAIFQLVTICSRGGLYMPLFVVLNEHDLKFLW